MQTSVTTPAINWIGLWTIIRREVQRLMRVPIQAFIAPWVSALMFIFIFGYVVGPRIAAIAGHRYLEFVLPGVLMMNIINAAFLQATSQIYFQRFMKYIEEALVAQLTVLNIFLIAPLSFVGGVFNTVTMLPPFLRWLAWGNPFFYFINGLRHSMIGFNEAPEPLGAVLSLALLAILSIGVWRLFSVGYGLRE